MASASGAFVTREGFRNACGEWLDENFPASLRGSREEIWGGRRASYPNPDSKIWLDRMAARGWTVPDWPREYGGGGLEPKEHAILREEMARRRCPEPLFDFGISLLGPVPLEFGSEQQKAEFLPQIARGEIRWCQGFSEPDAGSDLASLRCAADLEGDCYRVNGHKVWTSYGAQADWIFCLVRTDRAVPKRDGISFLLIDMATEGVSTAPMALISGASRFSEVLFDDVLVPCTNRLGEEHRGWPIAKKLLSIERAAISSAGASGILGEGGHLTLAELARTYREQPDPLLTDEIARVEMDLLAYRSALGRPDLSHLDGVARASFLKYYGTELTKRRCDLRARILGAQGLGWNGEMFSEDETETVRNWLWSRGYSILGGTSEIQLNVIARRGLGLPSVGAV
jgi:alkylation response protein AidB-like acyl-CoA dehydrogenase